MPLTIIFHCAKEKTLSPKCEFTTELLTEVSACLRGQGRWLTPKEKLWEGSGKRRNCRGCPRVGTRDLLCCSSALLADCSSGWGWGGRGHSYFPQIRALTLLPSVFRITILFSTCWLQAVALRGVWMSSYIFSIWASLMTSLLVPSRSVSLDSTTLQDHNGCFGLGSFMKWWYKSGQEKM